MKYVCEDKREKERGILCVELLWGWIVWKQNKSKCRVKSKREGRVGEVSEH